MYVIPRCHGYQHKDRVQVDILGARDWTPLHQAAFLGHAACVTALLAAGANPQRLNAGGHLPYKLAKQQKV
jgi:ankyrin repeat protein